MLSDAAALVSAAQGVLNGMGAPWLIATVLVLTTFLLEDLAIAAGVALATQGVISWELSLAAVGGGIALGDLGLYAAGIGATRVPWLRRRFIGERTAWARDKLESRLPSAVLLARVIPGLRLVTYTACGFLKLSFARFSGWVVLAVALWTGGLYLLSVSLGAPLARHLGVPPAVAVALPILVIALVVPLCRSVHRRIRSSAASGDPVL